MPMCRVQDLCYLVIYGELIKEFELAIAGKICL